MGVKITTPKHFSIFVGALEFWAKETPKIILDQFYSKKSPKTLVQICTKFLGPFLRVSKKHCFCSPKQFLVKKGSETAEVMPFQTQKTKNRCFSQNVEYVEWVLGMFLENVLLSAEMLNMLIMLNVFWTYRPFQVHPRENPTSNITAVRSTFSQMCYFQLKCWICWMCSWRVSEEVLCSAGMLNMLFMLNVFWTYRPFQVHPKQKTTFNIAAVRSIVFFKMCFFHLKCWICWMRSWNVFEKCVSFWGNVEYVEDVECFGTYRPFWMRPISSKNIQHIEHFPRKKHIFGERLSNIFNIFNMSAERSTFFWKRWFFQL